MTILKYILVSLCLAPMMGLAQEKTTFQTSGQWKPVTDIRSDVAIVYGAQDRRDMTFEERLDTWRKHGYKTHFMTGIAWGDYKDYFTGQWDGRWHLDEGQKEMNGDTIWHGRMVPYIVPTENYLKYFKERHIKRVVDAGVDAIFLEEPEFWARSGYSESFKREWKDYYGFDWRPQHESAENTYLSNKLKYHLYYRALQEAFTYAKEYGKTKGMNVRCYVPTHSLVNYSVWQIVSPEASLASLDCVDGYIAQVWTGTSRAANYFNGRSKERVFETAFLEYGCMQSMTAPTHRKVFFLTDPIEDLPRDWEDFKQNYQATFTAELLYPGNDNFEVMPWPDRIYEGLYRVSADSEEKAHIPAFYATQMQIMINALNFVPLSTNKVSGSQGISVLMANSLMFQRSPQPVEGYDDPQLSNFFGEAMPFVKRGVPVNIVHLENVAYPDTWKDTKVLLMSYSNLKPLDPKAHEYIADWVRKGGVLVYSGRDDDAYQRIKEWWTENGNNYNAPSEHLFGLMGMPADAAQGKYSYGEGKVYVIRQNPKEFVMEENGDAPLIAVVKKAYEEDAKAGPLLFKNSFLLERGVYDLISVVDENVTGNEPFMIKGNFIDLFTSTLPVVHEKVVEPGKQAFLVDLDRIADKQKPQVVAAASRQYDEVIKGKSYSFVAKSPLNTTNVMRILLPKKAKKIVVSDSNNQAVEFESSWDKTTNTLFLTFANSPDGISVKLNW